MADVPNLDLTNDVTDALFEAGCDDSSPGICNGRMHIDFAREAPTFKAAVLSAIRDVRKAKIGADVIRVDDINPVTQADIARRIGRSRQVVHQWISGTRGPGMFPAPTRQVTDGTAYYDWRDVAGWLVAHGMLPAEVLRDAEERDAINSVLELERQRHERPDLLKEVVRSILPKNLSDSMLAVLK